MHPAHPVSLHVLDPLQRLALGVDHERPAVALGDDGPVLGGEGVGGQALDVPVPYHGGLGQEIGGGEVWGAGDVQLADLENKRMGNTM